MKICFKGIIPPYQKNDSVLVYPISKDVDTGNMSLAVSATKDDARFLAEGVNGQAFYMGEDLVVKKSKGSKALVHNDVFTEAKKLDILYEFMNEGHKIGDMQKGICAFQDKDGDSYLISSFVQGKEPNPIIAPYNKSNLASLVSIITELDKGSDYYGRLMINDLNSGNLKVTETSAGILDIEHMATFKLDDSIEDVIINNNYGSASHTSDTSFLDSNLRSFEFASLYYYLMDENCDNGGSLFVDYLKTKGKYHKEMAEHYTRESNHSIYPNIVSHIANSEKAHCNLLSLEKILEDVQISEAKKIQMSNFIFVSSKWCNCPKLTFNTKQIVDYYKNGLNYFKSNLSKAISDNDKDKIVYYKDCVNVFKKWHKVLDIDLTMNENQKQRQCKDYQLTLDERLFVK